MSQFMNQCKQEEVLQFCMSDNGVGYFEPRGVTRPARVLCAFSSRLGGVSKGTFGSLNIGLHVGDREEHVLTNRQRLSDALGIDSSRWVAAQQVHGGNVVIVGQRERGRGSRSHETAMPAVDGLVTGEAGVWLTGYYADCVPLAFWDIQERAVGIAHSGWRGTLADVGSVVVREMVESLGCHLRDIHVLIGPAIGVCCYAVGEDLASVFSKRFGEKCLSPRRDHIYLDLRSANKRLLVDAGVPPDQIYVSNLCTACLCEAFYSYRRDESPTGRMVAIVGLRE